MNNKDKKDLKNYYSDVKLSEKEKNVILNDLHHQLSSQKNNICFVESKRKFFKPAVSVALSVCLITSALSYSKYHHSHDILIENEEKETTPVVTLETEVTTLWEEIIQSDKITSIPDIDNETSEISSSQSNQSVSEVGTEESSIKNTLGSIETAGSIETVQTEMTNNNVSGSEQTTNITNDETQIECAPSTTKDDEGDLPSDEPTQTTMVTENEPFESSNACDTDVTHITEDMTFETIPSVTSQIPEIATSTSVQSSMDETTAPQYTATIRTEGTTALEGTTEVQCTTIITEKVPQICTTEEEIQETAICTTEETTTTTESYTTTITTTTVNVGTVTTIPPVYEEYITTQPPEETFY